MSRKYQVNASRSSPFPPKLQEKRSLFHAIVDHLLPGERVHVEEFSIGKPENHNCFNEIINDNPFKLL